MSLPAATARYLCDLGTSDAGSSDADLLGRFIDRRDEAAFALLVRRHGDMVYGVCRRLLPEPDAEDAFQATFLVLAEKARTVAPRETVGNWLYGVARRAALHARRSNARRRQRMTELTDLPAPVPDPMEGLRALLDEEVSRLADAHRTVIVLCDLEGRTRKEAASILGWPEGTVAGRLAQARRLLAKRLARHAPAVSMAAILASTSRAPAAVLALTHPRVVPASVAALTRAVLANMAGGKLMKTVIAILLLGCAGFGMAMGVGQDKGNSPTSNPPVNTVAEKPVKAEQIFWGEEVDGLRAGLSLVEPSRIGNAGGSAWLEVKLKPHIRNVGKAPVTINYGAPREDKPTVIDGAGDAVRVTMPPVHFGSRPIYSRVIEPGETFALYDHELIVEVDAKQPLQTDVKVPTVRVPQGKYTISYSGMVSSHKKLATGGLPFKVMEPGDPKDADAVAWGKEVNGLQAGLVLKGARPYLQGETIKLLVRVRNVGKEAVEFRYCRATYFEDPPAVTDGKGKRIPLERLRATGFAALVPANLAPGKEIEVGEREIELKATLFGPGKFSVQYEQLETPENDKTLSKLATGKLELEVKEAKEAQRPADPQGRKEAEEFTAWGKEIGGLQAGLSWRSGGEYASETSTLVVRVRNVGKETVKFSYLQPFVEHSFTVIGSDGKPVPQPDIIPDVGEREAGVVELAPGKEMVLHEFKRRFLPAGESGSDKGKKPYAIYHGTGKIGIRYDHVFGPPDMGLPGWKLDPALGKLATGTLETEVIDTGKLGEPDDGPGGIAERYFLAALADRIDDAVELAVGGTSPAKRGRVEELAKQVKAIRVPTVYVSEDEALAVSEVVKLAKEQPDGADKIILVFKVVKSGGRWLVKDIDITTAADAKERVESFKTKHPAATTVPADVTPKSASENKLLGTWKLVSAKYDGETVAFPDGFTTVKHVTQTQFMWASYGKDGKVVRAAGGSYSLKGDVYEETPEYGVGRDFDGIKGKVQTFKWKVEGNRWHHTGKLDNGPTIDEVWERVEKK